MAVSPFAAAPKQANDAEFRAWGKALSDAITAVGIPKHTDTGQVDWTTVTYPTAINTAQGYEIRKFNDTLQGTYPVYIKIEYGSGAAATSPSIWITMGTATNGSGTLTGNITTRRQLLTTGNTATTYTCRVSGSTNRLLFAMWTTAGATTYSMFAAWERTHDASGADTSEGMLQVSGYTSGNNQAITYINGSGVVATETALGCLMPSVGAGSSGSAVALYPIFFTKGTYLNPMMNVLCVFQSNITPETPISFTYYGSTKTFRPINNASLVSAVRGAVSGSCFLLRDE